MAKNTSIALGDHFKCFAEKKVEQGRFGSVSEVVRAGLRLLEEYEHKVDALRKSIDQGLNSGPPQPFNFTDFIHSKKQVTKQGKISKE